MPDKFPTDLQLIVDILRAPSLAEAERLVTFAEKKRPKRKADALRLRLIALRPADGSLIIHAVAEAEAMLGDPTSTVLRECVARLQVWTQIAVGGVPAYGVDMFASAQSHWRRFFDDEAKSLGPQRWLEKEFPMREATQGMSPIVEVLLQENVFEAAEAAHDALKDAGVLGIMSWLTEAWIADRVLRRFAFEPDLARQASREIATALAESGKNELSLCWQLLAATPRNQMSFWSLAVNVKTLLGWGQLGEMSADEAKHMEQAIDVLQLCAEGAYVSETKSLWEILRPMLRDEEDAPPPRPAPLPRPVKRTPSGPTVVVMPSAPKMKSESAEFKDLVGAAVPLVVAKNVQSVRTTLRAEYPHALAAIDLLLRDVVDGKPVVVKPVLLNGPPGTGKSRLARRLGELVAASAAVRLHVFRFDCAAATDSQFAGVSKGWYSTFPCVPLRAIQQGGSANPMILLDEIEKAATGNQNGSLFSSLTGYLEVETSKRYRDQSLDAEVDLSHCSYVATSNDDTMLPPHIRDRFRVINVPMPTLTHLPQLAVNVIAEIEKQDGIEGFVAPLAPDELAVIGKAWQRAKFSIRALQKIVQATLDARAAFMMRH